MKQLNTLSFRTRALLKNTAMCSMLMLQAAQLEQIVLQQGMNSLHTVPTHITICSGEPTTYGLATSNSLLGYISLGAGNVLGAPTSVANGCTSTSASVTSGTITTTGTAAWWAVIDETGGSLWAHGSLASNQGVTAGNTFSLATFTINVPQR